MTMEGKIFPLQTQLHVSFPALCSSPEFIMISFLGVGKGWRTSWLHSGPDSATSSLNDPQVVTSSPSGSIFLV